MKKHRDDYPDPDDMFKDTRMSFPDHIEDLRAHLLRAIYGFLIGLFLALFVGKLVLQFIAHPVEVQLMHFWLRYNNEKHQEIVDDLERGEKNGKPVELPKYTIDLDKLAAALAPRLNLPAPKERELDLVPAFARALEPTGLDQAIAKQPGVVQRWLVLEPEREQFVTSMQRFNLLIKPPTLSTLSPQEAFLAYVYVSMLTGLVITSPWVFLQIWAFIAAGLYPHEKKLVNVYLPFSLGLFLAGVFLCELFVIPRAVEALLWFNDWLGLQPELRFNEWLGFAIMMPLVFGVAFQTPLAMLFTEKIGLFDVPIFRKSRRIAWFLMFVLAMLISPAADGVSLLLLAVPMCLLYELGILLCVLRPRSEFEELEAPESQEMVEV